MNVQDEVMSLEIRFWKGDAEFYRANLAADSVMVFGEPVGVLTREQAARSVEGAPRWSDIRMDDVHVAPLGEGAVLVTYRATARRDQEAQPYTARASSAYVREAEGWKLAFHQQTPGG